MNYKGKRVLVLDGFGRQQASILRQLHDLGCIITTINASKLDVGYASRYPHKRKVVPGIRNDELLYKEVIKRELATGNYDIVFPMIEKSTNILTIMKDNGELGDVKAIVAPRAAFLKAYDKEETMRICQEINVPCPRTKMDEESLDEYLSKVMFPLACKPRKGSGSAGFKKVESREELEKYIADGIIKVEEYVIQEFIPHSGTRYSCRVFLDKNQQVIFNVGTQIFRSFPVDGGPGCYSRTINRPDVKEYSERLLKKLGWVGLAHVCFMYDPRDNTPKIIEINGRIPSGIKICDLVGVKTVKAMFDMVYDVPMSPYPSDFREGEALRYFHTDIVWLFKSADRFRSKPSWFNFRHNHDYIWSWRDPLPFITYTIEHLMTYRADMKKREH